MTLRACGAALLCLAAAACDSIGPPGPPPAPPLGNDLRFQVSGVDAWYLVGNDLTPGQDTIELAVSAPSSVEVIDAWIDGGPGQRLTRDDATHTFSATLDIGALPAGDHAILLAYDGKDRAFAQPTFRRTHPLYFLLSTDWDFSEPGQGALDYHDMLRARHPDIKFTMFVGPYTYTDPAMTAERQDQITSWLTSRRDQYGDEIGLHIHPYCNFVEAAGLTCITDQSTVYPSDASGYTIKLEAYHKDGLETLLAKADEIFTARGLGKPITFRAGGWTASSDNLAALADQGFVADTSALNWMRLEEWMNVQSGELYRWNMTNWSSIGDTSQPYWPNTTDKQSPDAPHTPILEVPDNAIMVDYVTKQEMIDIFGENWGGAPLAEPHTYMMGFHPSPDFNSGEYLRVDGILGHADGFLASKHAGPVVYEVLRDMPRVWKQPLN